MRAIIRSGILVILSVLLVACASGPGKESTGEYVDNSMITVKVKTKLLRNEQVKALPITVKSFKNTVQLSGFVDSTKSARKAEQLALAVNGVDEVVNNLIVK